MPIELFGNEQFYTVSRKPAKYAEAYYLYVCGRLTRR
jgi:hypothetical protein